MATEATPSTTTDISAAVFPNKRKVFDAFDALDDASRPYTDVLDQPSPAKRPHLPSAQSVYLKYGLFKSSTTKPSVPRVDTISKFAPHLAAIIARTRKTPALDTPKTASSSSKVEYRPASVQQFLARLCTFKLATYANKPAAVDAVAASKCGWVHDGGKDRLLCEICRSTWVVAGREGMNRDAANTLVAKQTRNLIDMHRDDCPWKVRQCDASIYCIPLQPSSRLARQIKLRAMDLKPLLSDVQIKHPLTAPQLASLNGIFATLNLPSPEPTDEASPDPQSATGWSTANSEGKIAFPSSEVNSAIAPSETAILIALFGWGRAPPAIERPTRGRTSSLTPSRSGSRASSVALGYSRASTPAPGDSRPTSPISSPMRPPARPRVSSLTSRPATPTPPGTLPSTPMVPGQGTSSSMLYCTLCQRRVGLWTFAPPSAETPTIPSRRLSGRAGSDAPRAFDLLKEHRSYCPYVVASTTVASLPVAAPQSATSTQGGGTTHSTQTMEGWKAVVEVILRLRSTMTFRSTPSLDNAAEPMEVDGEVDRVGAMVANVKARGGKELLRYVKGLLG